MENTQLCASTYQRAWRRTNGTHRLGYWTHLMGPSPWPSWIALFHGQFHEGRPLYIHNCSSDASSLHLLHSALSPFCKSGSGGVWANRWSSWPLPWCGQCWAGYFNTGWPPRQNMVKILVNLKWFLHRILLFSYINTMLIQIVLALNNSWE